jgi:hypothetical protein
MRGRSGISKVTIASLNHIIAFRSRHNKCLTVKFCVGIEQGAREAPQSCHRVAEEPGAGQGNALHSTRVALRDDARDGFVAQLEHQVVAAEGAFKSPKKIIGADGTVLDRFLPFLNPFLVPPHFQLSPLSPDQSQETAPSGFGAKRSERRRARLAASARGRQGAQYQKRYNASAPRLPRIRTALHGRNFLCLCCCYHHDCKMHVFASWIYTAYSCCARVVAARVLLSILAFCDAFCFS